MAEKHNENGNSQNFNFSRSMTKTSLAAWLYNWPNITDEELALLDIYKVGDEKTKFTITTNEQGQLVATDGKNKLLLENAEWSIPAKTLEILNKKQTKNK